MQRELEQHLSWLCVWQGSHGPEDGVKTKEESEMTNPERKHGHPLRTLVIHTEGPGRVWDLEKDQWGQ